MKKNTRQRISRLIKYAIPAIILFLVILHFVRPAIDPPFFFAGYSQADLTDPYHLTFYARNAVLFDDWDPFDYQRWDVFKNSLVSGAAYLVFLALGVSRSTANLTAIILNLGGLALLAFGLFRLRSRREIIFTILLLLLNATLFFHSRLPFLENGLIFLSGLTFFVFMRYHEKRWGQFLIGFLLILAALAGKLFGFLLLGPILLSYWYRYRASVIKPLLLTLAGALVSFIFYLVLFYGGDITVMAKYYSEQTVGLHGSPIGFSTPWHFLRNLIFFGGNFGLFELSIFPALLAYIGLLLLILTLPLRKPFHREFLPIVFSLGWLVVGVFGLMPFTYQTLRYVLFLFLPVAAIAAFGLNLLFEKKIELNLHTRWITLGAVLFTTWYILTQLYLLTVPFGTEYQSARRAMPLTLIPSLLMTAGVYIYLRNQTRLLPRRALIALAALLSLGLLIEQGSYLYQGLMLPQNNLERCNYEISQLIDEQAVLAGTYAPPMTIDNNLKGVIYFFGSVDVETGLFEKYPISHVITDETNWKRAAEDFPLLAQAVPISRFVIRDFSVTLFRLPGATVPPTDFEKAVMAHNAGQYDSALVYQENFHRRYPENRSSLMSLALAHLAKKSSDAVNRQLFQMAHDYPDDLQIQLFLRKIYNDIYTATKDPRYKLMSDNFDRRAKELDPALIPRTR